MKTLTDSLAVSNAEAEVVPPEILASCKLRMEALGVESASKDRAKLEQRLLTAVSDLQLVQKRTEAYREQLLRLSEAMLRYAEDRRRAAMPQARMDVEAQLRSDERALIAKDRRTRLTKRRCRR